ncbi:MAG TPA: hypothetical protein VFO67_10710 [Gemmatimonadales bacterium]|nr:hypothetical protein [Gemmatimonadales bacterium]
MSKPLQAKYFLALLALLSCGGKKKADEQPTPQELPPTAPLPTAGLAGQRVALTPLTLVGAEDTLRWDSLLADRRAMLDKSDSIIGALLSARAPEVTWVGPAELRRTARRAAGVATDPDQLGTAFLRADKLIEVPDPLRYQLRTLVGLAGGRFAMIPAGLVYRRRPGRTDATAELSIVMVDTRVGRVGWRTVARGDGEDPWTALTKAVKSLTPGLP